MFKKHWKPGPLTRKRTFDMKGAPTVVESVFCQGPTKVVPFLWTDMGKNHRYPSSHLTTKCFWFWHLQDGRTTYPDPSAVLEHVKWFWIFKNPQVTDGQDNKFTAKLGNWWASLCYVSCQMGSPNCCNTPSDVVLLALLFHKYLECSPPISLQCPFSYLCQVRVHHYSCTKQSTFHRWFSETILLLSHLAKVRKLRDVI